MKEALGMGVVGAGAIGIRGACMHLSQPDVQDRVRLVAISDPFVGRAEAAAAKYGVARYYLTYEKLLADSNVDMVTICSPIGLHFEQGLRAIEAGKHIHFNKTMATTTAEADELIDRAAKKELKIVASPGVMLFPHNQRERRLVLSGALGKLAWAIAGTSGAGDYHMHEEHRTGKDALTDINPSWYFKKPGGGPQYDMTVYCLHTITGILGPVKRVTAVSGRVIPERDYHGEKIICETDDTTMLTLDFGESLFVFVYASVGGSLTYGFQPNIYGMRASIIGTMFGQRDLTQPFDFPPHVIGVHSEMAEYHIFEDMMQLTDWVRNGKISIVNAEHARHVIEIIEAGYTAAQTGQIQNLRTGFEPMSMDALIE
ncbi:MAG: oxidoreductase [Candidatus Yanofskybacteria bacterium RIFCSPHIGHO2_02_FULL_41_11]|uniref:Oxidoreductase n=1 Tax=Candidatus Yanofskybacteria bacterium RIFCSPHIGHO2_02_FULL_41_11 TaxID=1802675 RepID=A0A1F8FEF9_9BACT|nr:MAG: oxidoreductase [Candidatus Yanofskybacteria bacterium RIFCSPHIGHO2_02_FULL_41_11]